MTLPAFYSSVPRLRVRDPLAEFLGAAEHGILEYGFEDAVKLAGHSCPTVASAYALGYHSLSTLYPDELPERGGVRIDFAQPLEAGVTGVIASVLGLLSGAAQQGGFKGLADQFVRRDLQRFGADQPLALRFTRLDNGACVDAQADLSRVPAAAEMPTLLRRCLNGEATVTERRLFGQLWQQRVAQILLGHWGDKDVFVVVPRKD